MEEEHEMTWFSILKISRKDAIADAKRFAPEDMEEGRRKKAVAYSRFRAREGRNPSKEELREEIINPFYRPRPPGPGRPKGSKNKPKPKFEREKTKKLVNNIILYLEANDMPVTEESVMNEMDFDEKPDEEFVDYIRSLIDEFKY